MMVSMQLKVDLKSSDAGEMHGGEMSIGEIASRFGLATHVLRHWESMGLLAPSRVNGRRRYSFDDLFRIDVILQAKEVGLHLDEIREMLTTTDPKHRRAILRRQHTELAERIARAQASLEMIEHGLKCPHEDFTTCPNFQRKSAERIGIALSTRV